jgi:hypothetical protein
MLSAEAAASIRALKGEYEVKIKGIQGGMSSESGEKISALEKEVEELRRELTLVKREKEVGDIPIRLQVP